MKRRITALAASIAALCMAFALPLFIPGAAEGASRTGSGFEVIARGVSAVKTGRKGEKLAIGENDFKSALAVTDFDSVKITRLPDSNDGMLLQAGRRVRVGQVIKKRALATFIFVPDSKDVTEASFEFVLNGVGLELPVCFTVRLVDGGNTAPAVSVKSQEISTQSGVAYVGRLEGSDKDGDRLEFIPVVFPRRGALVISDRGTGEFSYTPNWDFVGYDRFTYIVRDEYGNFSAPCEIRVNVTERLSAVVFSDMLGRSEYGAAIAMDALGVIQGETRGNVSYFMPDGRVTRAEFVAMAMKLCGLTPVGDTTVFFDDGGDVPDAYTSYVAYAAVTGIVDGDLTDGRLVFRPNDSITRQEAAVIMARLIGVGGSKEDCEYSEIDGVKSWALPQVQAMLTLGVLDYTDGTFGADAPLTRAEVAEYLYRLGKVKKG